MPSFFYEPSDGQLTVTEVIVYSPEFICIHLNKRRLTGWSHAA